MLQSWFRQFFVTALKYLVTLFLIAINSVMRYLVNTLNTLTR